jgi:hypothetical protein
MPFNGDYHVEQSATGDVTLDKNTDLLTAIIAAPANVTLPLAANCKGDKAKKTVINDTTSSSTLSFVASGSDTIVGITGSGAGDGAVLESDGYSKWFIVRGSSGVGATVSESELVTADNTTANATSSKHGLMPKLTPGVATANQPVTLGASKNLDVLALPVSGLKIGTAGAEVAVDPSAAEFNVLKSAVVGTVVASKALVADANKAIDVSRVTTSRTVGGTGVPGAAGVVYEFTKEVTAIAENTATTVLTVTVPNAAHAAVMEILVMARQGAGGTIGADESVTVTRYQAAISRTAGVASVLVLSSAIGNANSKVSGGDTDTAVLTQVAVGEGVGATNTHSIQVTIDSANNSSGNHKCDLFVRLFNANASGITVA